MKSAQRMGGLRTRAAIYRHIALVAVTASLLSAVQPKQVLFENFNVTSRSSLMAVPAIVGMVSTWRAEASRGRLCIA